MIFLSLSCQRVLFHRVCQVCLSLAIGLQRAENRKTQSSNMSEDRNYSNPAAPMSNSLPCLTRKPRCSRSPRIFPASTPGLASRAGACVTLDQPSQLPALSALARERAPLLVLGGGSNVVLPETVPGLVARVRFQGVRLLEARPDAWLVEAAGGENWHGFVSTCVEQGWDGLENLALIPVRWGVAGAEHRRLWRRAGPALSQPDGLGCATGAHGGDVRGGLLFFLPGQPFQARRAGPMGHRQRALRLAQAVAAGAGVSGPAAPRTSVADGGADGQGYLRRGLRDPPRQAARSGRDRERRQLLQEPHRVRDAAR